MKAYTSRSRFDERRNFTGVFQQMGRVSLDADWNEEVLIRSTDTRRRSHDLAQGSPDDGFLVSDEQLLDRIAGTAGWSGNGLAADDQRAIPASLTLDRREPEGLPRVLRAQGHRRLRRLLDAPLDLSALALAPSGSFAADTLVFSLRFARPPNDDDVTAVAFFVEDADGATAVVAADFGAQLPTAWHHQRVPVSALPGIDLGRVAAWGVDGLPPRALSWVDALRATDAALRQQDGAQTGPDLVIRGGDGSIGGAGRMLVDGVRACLPRDVRYSRQPDLPRPPLLAELAPDDGRAHLVYLDCWEQLVTTLDDDFLSEPALDGLDTTVRLQLLRQVKVLQDQPATAEAVLPPATGGGLLTTNVAADPLLPDRYPTPPIDPCRDRCLFTENASTGDGYSGAHNLHLRIELLDPLLPLFAWSRDNGATRLALEADAPAEATSLSVSAEDALKLSAGDLVTLCDPLIDRQPEGPRVPVLRAVKGVDPGSGTVYLEDEGFDLSHDGVPLPAGGAIGQAFRVAERAYVRRWDGADRLLDDVRYNLPDGITFRFTGGGWRRGDYWSLTARIENADGEARGSLQQLSAAPVHGPVHHYAPLARVTRDALGYQFEDLRPRFLPLNEVRDRLAELVARPTPTGAFTLIIGDGVRTFGDLDQDVAAGVTGDEVLQSAVQTLCAAGGGSIYLRAGRFQLEKPVQLLGCSRLRILGDGAATELRLIGGGGGLLLDDCGAQGEVVIERLALVEVPREGVVFGDGDGGVAAPPLPPLPEPIGPLQDADLIAAGGAASSFADNLVAAIRGAAPLTRRGINGVQASIRRLRELQRQNPGQPLEQVAEAAALLARLQRLPHGLVTVSDSRRVTLSELSLESREPRPEAGGVFITGTCAELRVSRCRIAAASAVIATAYAPYLSPTYFAANPRSGLDLDQLRIDDNRLHARGDASGGITLSQGRLRGLHIDDNQVVGFNVGITVADRAELDRGRRTGARVCGNRVSGSAGLGIDIVGSGVELADNVVENATPDGLFQAGIRVQGSAIRVRGCTVTLPASAAAGVAASPLALSAGIVVGAGVDAEADTGADGALPGPQAVQDVEVATCRLSGAGAATPGIGVLVGGPQPVLDLRVRDCSFSELGDAAVRVWGHGGRNGRIRIDDNRIDGAALAVVPARADAQAGIDALSAAVGAELRAAGVDASDPRALLQALTASASTAVIGPLDGLLRWIAMRTLRGAIVVDQVEDGEVVDNRIHRVGSSTGAAGAGIAAAGVGDDSVRTGAIAAVGVTDLVISGNLIEHVVAEQRRLDPPAAVPRPPRPAALDALAGLDLRDRATRSGDTDVHGATTALRRLIVSYGGGTDPERMRIGRRIYAAMDALVDDLDAFGGRGAKIAAALVLEADSMRSAQGRDDHTVAAHRLRATLSRAAAFTAGDDPAQAAWEAAAQFDLGVVEDNSGAVARRLQDSAAVLASGLPERRAAIEDAMALVLTRLQQLAAADTAGEPAAGSALEQAQIAAAAELGTLGEWRDAAHLHHSGPRPAEVFGANRVIIKRFAERIDGEAARLAVDADAGNRNILDGLQADKDALVETIGGANSELARALEADWGALERSVTDDKKTRLRATLNVVRDWTEGGSGRITGTDSATGPATVSAANVERQADAGNAALIGMVAGHIDSGIGRLLVEREGVKTKNLKVLQGAGSQLQNLVSADPEAADLASKATAAIRAAAADTQQRGSELARARSFLDALRRRSDDRSLRPATAPLRRPPMPSLDRRLASLAALLLSVRGLDRGERGESLDSFRDHFERLLDSTEQQGRNRARALAQVSDADAALRRSASAGDAAAIHALMRELDRVATAIGSREPLPSLAAASVLVRAATQALDSGEDEPTRLLRVQAYLRERGTSLTQSTHQALARHSALAALIDGLAAVLERLALGEQPRVTPPEPPFFEQRLAAADGIFAAGSRGRLRIAGNQVQHAVRGASLLGSGGHALVDPGAASGDGLVLQIAGNRIDGCALGGLDLRPDGTASINLLDNEVFASAGVGEDGAAGIGQAVAQIAGSGDLIVQGNLFQGNGHRHPRAILHELLVDWRGEAVIRGNTIRHLGGGAGGAALLLLAEPQAGTLPMTLATAPFLGIEPPPRPPTATPGAIDRPFFPNLPVLAEAVSGNLRAVGDSGHSSDGRLLQRVSATHIAPRLLTAARPPRFSALAADNARRYLNRELVPPLGRVLDFVRRRPYHKPPAPPPPPQQRTFHIEGNDLAASGPALLLIGAEQGDLISTSIVGNGLHSEGGTGAAYLRYCDSLVFASNRCQAPDAVTVVVIRALAAAVSVNGNLVAGREPVIPPLPPLPPRRPSVTPPLRPGQVTLTLPVGTDAGLTVPIDAGRLRGSIESFTGAAQKAFSNVLVERAAAEQSSGPFLAELELHEAAPATPGTPSTPTPAAPTTPGASAPGAVAPGPAAPATGGTPAVGPTAGGAPPVIGPSPVAGPSPIGPAAGGIAARPLDSGSVAPAALAGARASKPFASMLSSASSKFAIAPFSGAQRPDTVLKYIQGQDLASRDIEALLRGTEIEAFADDASRQAFKNQVDSLRINKKAQELAARSSADEAVERGEAATVFKRVAGETDTQAGALATMAKLFTAQGFSAERTSAELQLLLEKSDGNATQALDSLHKDIFASDDATPYARNAIADIGLLEQVLADGLFTGGDVIADPEPSAEQTEPPPPDPHSHSLVVFGGSAVAAVGNTTTAGTLVQDAQQSVELNV